MPALFAAGDIHGQYDTFLHLLRSRLLVDAQGSWTGADAQLWLTGGLLDCRPQAIPGSLAVLDHVIRLQGQAAASGGKVVCLLGEQEVLLLAAVPASSPLRSIWTRCGGREADLELFTAARTAWLVNLPAMEHAGGRLWVHADALFYTEYGSDTDEVNAAIARLLRSPRDPALERLVEQFGQRNAYNGPDGIERARGFLLRSGGDQLVHGHTPIHLQTGQPPESVTGPRIYAGGLCVNLDGGLGAGGPGFLHRFPDI